MHFWALTAGTLCSAMGNAQLWGIFLAFFQLCHMDYLQVDHRNPFQVLFGYWSNGYYLLFYVVILVILFLQSVVFHFTIIAAVLLKKFAGEEGERVDVQKLFGYIGLFTLVALWWLGKRC